MITERGQKSGRKVWTLVDGYVVEAVLTAPVGLPASVSGDTMWEVTDRTGRAHVVPLRRCYHLRSYANTALRNIMRAVIGDDRPPCPTCKGKCGKCGVTNPGCV